ncbi:MAG TPA: aminoacyl-tRNA hydrolase [Actinobacteria bacterium]|nr:aminoacyl-tRNA hydrolase [Actinomycetota bacterium]
MKVIIGLRNPQAEYLGTRHNIGAEVIEVLADRWELKLKRGPMRVRADLASHRFGEHKVVIGLLRSAMNVSGNPTKALIDYHKVDPSDLLVLHDDIDLAFAKLRLQFGRGSGGNNGAKSLIRSLGTRDFWRLKMGVGRPPGRMDPAAFVLRRFSIAERAEIDLLVQDAADAAEAWITNPDAAIQQAAQRPPPG